MHLRQFFNQLVISAQPIFGTGKFVENKWENRHEKLQDSENFSQPQQKKRKTAIHCQAQETWMRERALINVSTAEKFHSTKQKSLGKQLSLVLSFLNKYQYLFKWSQLQRTLLSSSCWLRWGYKSVKITELGHILHSGALNLLFLHPVGRWRCTSQHGSHSQQHTWLEGVLLLHIVADLSADGVLLRPDWWPQHLPSH